MRIQEAVKPGDARFVDAYAPAPIVGPHAVRSKKRRPRDYLVRAKFRRAVDFGLVPRKYARDAWRPDISERAQL